jgi:hypothetical protein
VNPHFRCTMDCMPCHDFLPIITSVVVFPGDPVRKDANPAGPAKIMI